MVRVSIQGGKVNLTAEEWACVQSVSARCGFSDMELLRLMWRIAGDEVSGTMRQGVKQMNKSSIPGEVSMSEKREAYDGHGPQHNGGVTQEDIRDGKVNTGRYPAPGIALAEQVVRKLENLEQRLTEAENAIPALRLNRPMIPPVPVQELSSGNAREDFLEGQIREMARVISELREKLDAARSVLKGGE